MNLHYIYKERTDSTNNDIKALLATNETEEGCVVWCGEQYAGRGQRGNSWESEPNKNITFSLLLRPEWLPLEEQFRLSQLISLAIWEVLSEYDAHFAIKWPNDIYRKDKKIGGILIENSISGKALKTCIAGIGININQGDFFSDAPNPISLSMITGIQYDRETLLHAFSSNIVKKYLSLKNNYSLECKKLHSEYMAHIFRKEGYHNYRSGDQVFTARIAEIKPSGHLILITAEGAEMCFAFKEVTFLL